MLRSIIGNGHVSPRLCRGFAASASVDPGKNPRQSRGLTGAVVGAKSQRRSFTLVEMLVAMAITLVMMGAVVTLFANISNSVRNRRATIEMSAQLRHVRNVLQQDLQGATCPGVTWQRPESNHGYIEIIEGPYKEGYATNLVDGIDNPGSPDFSPEIDHATSILPSSNLDFASANPTWATDAGALGDYDDILMLTTRNEHEPFVGRIPKGLDAKGGFKDWGNETIQSPLAEVVWFAIENPAPSENVNNFFGEPGMRTIYRRTLLIAPWINPYNDPRIVDPKTGLLPAGFKPVPGLVRVFPSTVKNQNVEEAIAGMIAFQDRYDLSVRLEWDSNIVNGSGRWKIMANTLGDLTKRENRFGHFFYRPVKSGAKPVGREYPFALVSTGSGYSGSSANLQFVTDPDPGLSASTAAKAIANLASGTVASYSVTLPGTGYVVRPFAFVSADSTTIATAQAMLNDDGSVVRLVLGPVPLWGARRGEDVMMTNALAFDLRVYDPGAPMFATLKKPGDPTQGLDVVLTPSDPGWLDAYMHNDNMKPNGTGSIGNNNAGTNVMYPYVGQGAYVDLGYGFNTRNKPPALPTPTYALSFASSAASWFFEARALSDVYLDSRLAVKEPKDWSQLAPGYAVYDTWSFHYENDGVNEDELRFDGTKWQQVDTTIDEGTNGLDDKGDYSDAWNAIRLGVDDVGERETAPPYDKPLRGMQVLIRSYERDSRSIRQVRVNQHFMQE
jgi:type II secretory pathway pseudopilin PulG